MREKIVNARSLLRFFVGLVLSGLALWIVFRRVDGQDLMKNFHEMRWDMALVGFLFVILNLIVRPLRWHMMLRGMGPVRLLTSLRLTWIGFLINNVLPARMGDLYKGMLLAPHGFSRVQGVTTVALERVMDTALLILLFGIFVNIADLAIEFSPAVRLSIVALVLLTVFALLLFVTFSRFYSAWVALVTRVSGFLPHKAREYLLDLLEKIKLGLDCMASPFVFWSVIGLSISIWFIDACVPYFLALSFGIELTYFQSLILLISVAIGSMVPSAPGSIGVFQLVCVLFLSPFGIEEARSLGLGLIWNLSLYVFFTVFGILGLLLKRFDPGVAPEGPVSSETM